MRILPCAFLAVLALPCPAQEPAPTPKNDPFANFGSSLDQRPAEKRHTSRNTPPPTSSMGSSLDQRPVGWNAATPPPQVSRLPPLASARGLSIEVKSVGNGGVVTSVNQEHQASVTKETTGQSKTTLEVRVRNLANQADAAHLEWFFLAGDVHGGNQYMWDKGQRDLPVAAASERRELIVSVPLQRVSKATTNYTAWRDVYSDGSVGGDVTIRSDSYSEQSGARPYGWVVELFVGGKMAAIQASSPTLAMLGRDVVQFNQLLNRKPPTNGRPQPSR